MNKKEMEFAVVVRDDVVVRIGKSSILQPKTNFKGGGIKWFDDTKLIREESTYCGKID